MNIFENAHEGNSRERKGNVAFQAGSASSSAQYVEKLFNNFRLVEIP